MNILVQRRTQANAKGIALAADAMTSERKTGEIAATYRRHDVRAEEGKCATWQRHDVTAKRLPVDGALADEVEHHERDGAGDAQQDDGHGDRVELERSLATRVVRLHASSHRVRLCSRTRHTTLSDTWLL